MSLKISKKHNHSLSNLNSCVLCGNEIRFNGKIFRGHCVCEECVDYVCHIDTKSNPTDSAVENKNSSFYNNAC